MFLFLGLCFVGIAIGGICAFVIFWPLSLVHLRDRHPAVVTLSALGMSALMLLWAVAFR